MTLREAERPERRRARESVECRRADMRWTQSGHVAAAMIKGLIDGLSASGAAVRIHDRDPWKSRATRAQNAPTSHIGQAREVP
jgi:hypothetical protein